MTELERLALRHMSPSDAQGQLSRFDAEQQLELEPAPAHPRKPHDSFCTCADCRAWSRQVMRGPRELAQADMPASLPRRPHPPGACSFDCAACVEWARQVVAAPGVPNPRMPAAPAPRPSRLPPSSSAERAIADQVIAETMESIGLAHRAPRRDRRRRSR